MKTIVDCPEYVSALFEIFGSQPDNDPANLEMEDTLIRYSTSANRNGIPVLAIAPGISLAHIGIQRNGHLHQLIVTFSESETELLRRSLLVVPVAAALAA